VASTIENVSKPNICFARSFSY